MQRIVEDVCRESGWPPPLWLETTVEDPGTGEARQALKEEVDVVIAVDGTVQSAAWPRCQPGAGTLGVIPLGTDAGLKEGWLAYVDAGIRNLAGKPVRAKISIDGQPPVRRRVRSVIVGNCGKVHGGVEIFPGALVDDGILDLVVIAPLPQDFQLDGDHCGEGSRLTVTMDPGALMVRYPES